MSGAEDDIHPLGPAPNAFWSGFQVMNAGITKRDPQYAAALAIAERGWGADEIRKRLGLPA